MKKENIVQYKADELPETTKTDWKRLDAMTEAEYNRLHFGFQKELTTSS